MNTITRSILFPSLPALLRTRLLVILASATLATCIHTANAGPADLDLTFGGTGRVSTAIGIGSAVDNAYSVAIQSDGKIVVAGNSYNGSYNDFAVVRYNSNGSLDTTFNGTGKVTTGPDTHIVHAVAIQTDKKIVAVGVGFPFNLVRYNENGSLDTTFSGTGKAATGVGESYGVAMQSDGKIVVAVNGGSGFAVVRFESDGTLDATFNGTGMVTTSIGSLSVAYSVAIQSDGKIVAAGVSHTGGNDNFALVRYNGDGSLDTTFNGTGKVTTEFGSVRDDVWSVALQGDGKIVAAGSGGGGFALARYNSDGSLDTGFGNVGKVIIMNTSSGDSGATGVAIQTDGKIVAVGSPDLIRFNPNGSLDTTFNGTGILEYGDGASVAMQTDGKIVVAGSSLGGFTVARYVGDLDTDGDGILDRYETGTGVYVSPTDTGTSPTNPDTDGDGLNDGKEVNTYHSNPHVRDTDGDGFEDDFEVETGFSPTSAASTPDALSSIRTAVEYRFNAALGISYRIEASPDLANWTTIETNIIGAGGVITRFYSIEGQPKRFFRSRRN